MLDTVLLGVICYVIVDVWAEKRQIKYKAKALYRKTWQNLTSIFTRGS
jgi:hypothetical protein